MKLKVLFVAVLIMASCAKNKKQESVAETVKEVETPIEKDTPLEVYDFEGFEKYLNQKDDKIYVINFWATWCAPCVKELPYFEQLHANYKDKKVEVLLVSLDFPHMYDSKLKPFIKDRKLISKVIALDDPDMNTWIPKVSETWSGALPATVIYNQDKRLFFEQSFTYKELENEVKNFLN
ncbi:TlpA family protein disulfide reductase [Tamlana agarivorans]|uniref:TlpA family protein disulfide reductase n=1 Tax=Pseudotamlana agarivorans TaxID=481183 RepID=A0ACC5UAH8_9FLAO|nr:TlpA disulfide reductase family protein [Tamlana agarivorans]MBU2951322.1 TlpA family protein disulfide reductase [Tamlana agarivorans]